MRYTVAEGEFGEPKDYQKFGAPRGNRKHMGLDLANGKNFNCFAYDNGKLVKRPYNSDSGYSIWIYHQGCRTLYAHLTKESYDQIGDGQVKKGQWCGVAGMSGNATGICLHFELHLLEVK